MDFNLSTYQTFLKTLLKNYNFLTFEESILGKVSFSKFIILRHDVDRLFNNSFITANMENSIGIKGTYYFRIVSSSYNEEVMTKISEMGHEIGYHYEDVDLILKSSKRKERGNLSEDELIEMAYERFCKSLELFRKHFDIKTICMHGSPRSRYDNKLIWQKYNYKDLGIIGEPYYDIDFSEFAYFTDTGRRWDGNSVSVRDKVESNFKFQFKTTHDIINNIDKLPDKIMFTIHPERWSDNFIDWSKQLVMQNIKNIVKKYFFINR